MPTYATSAEYAASPYGGTAPSDIDNRLARASLDVDRMLIGRVYDTDPDTELPTDEKVAAALREATIAQATHVAAQESGASAAVAAIGFASGSITYAGDGAPGRPGTDDRDAPDALNILQLAGLCTWIGTP